MLVEKGILSLVKSLLCMTQKGMLGMMPGWLCHWLGQRRRRRGRYDRRTLDCFRLAWKRCRSRRNLLAYLKCRRDFGYPPPGRLGSLLLREFSCAPASQQRLLVNWLSEAGRADLIQAIRSSDLRELADRSPAAAAALVARGEALSGFADSLARMHLAQADWLAAFAAFLRQHKDSICVVGNAGSLDGAGLGGIIDGHQVVVRFNHYSAGNQAGGAPFDYRRPPQHDIGGNTQVWVRAPNLTPPYPPLGTQLRWVLITGPDVRYQLSSWQEIVPLLHRGCRVLTVPLVVWRALVRELRAPPSAGLLVLAWIMRILNGPEGLAAAGFQRRPTAERYHYALHGHKPAQRHNWQAERALLCRWQAAGLRFVD